MIKHKQYREGDEVVCTRGYRWDVNESDPHVGDK